MKVLFKNKTKYTKEMYKEFLEFHEERYGTTYYLYTIIFILAFVFYIVMQLKYANYLLALITAITLIGFVFWRFYHPIKTVKKEIKSKKIEEEQEFTFKFYDKNFLLYGKKLNVKMYYWQLKRVFETEDKFYLYLDKTDAFILDKQGFEIGKVDDFREFIKRKCIFRYKKYN